MLGPFILYSNVGRQHSQSCQKWRTNIFSYHLFYLLSYTRKTRFKQNMSLIFCSNCLMETAHLDMYMYNVRYVVLCKLMSLSFLLMIASIRCLCLFFAAFGRRQNRR